MRFGIVLTGIALVASACGGTSPTTSAPVTTAEPSAATTIATTSSNTVSAASTTTTTSAPPTTASDTTEPVGPDTTGPVDAVPDGSLPIVADYLVYGGDGILAVTRSGELVRLSADPTAVAIGIGDALVVSQGGADAVDGVRPRRDGPIIVHEPDGERPLPTSPDEQLLLFDAGIVAGRPVAVATSRTGGGWEMDERLLLIDVETAERTDLGIAGYYEAPVEYARLSGELVVIKMAGQEHLIEARSLDGAIVWSVEGTGSFETPGHLVVAEDAVLLIDSGFVGDDFSPVLEVVRFDGTSGEQTERETLEVDAEFGGGFCLLPDWDGARLLCEESYGGPFALDLETGSVTKLTALDIGIVSAVRR